MAKLEEVECKGCGGIMNVENKAKHNQLPTGAGRDCHRNRAGLCQYRIDNQGSTRIIRCFYWDRKSENCLCRSCRAMLQ